MDKKKILTLVGILMLGVLFLILTITGVGIEVEVGAVKTVTGRVTIIATVCIGLLATSIIDWYGLKMVIAYG
jgi:hypothetical protein